MCLRSEIESVSDAAKITNMVRTGAQRDEICFEKDSVESNMKPKILADRLRIMGLVEGRERGVDYFRGLLRETDKKEFSFRGIKSKIIRRHPR